MMCKKDGWHGTTWRIFSLAIFDCQRVSGYGQGMDLSLIIKKQLTKVCLCKDLSQKSVPVPIQYSY